MIDWLAVKRAADRWEPYVDDFFRPLTEAEARAFMAMRNGTPQAHAFNPEMQRLKDPATGQLRIGDVPVYDREVDDGVIPRTEEFYENGAPVKRYYVVDNDGNEIPENEVDEWNRLRNEAPTMEEADKYATHTAWDYLRPDGSVADTWSITNPNKKYHEKEDWDQTGYASFVGNLEDKAIERAGLQDWKRGFTMSPEEYNDFISRVDPNGYLRKYGLADYSNDDEYFNAAERSKVFHNFLWKRGNTDFLRYMKNERPDEYEDIVQELGYNPVEQMEAYKDPRQRALEKMQMQQQKATRRWGNSMINLTPQQYAYYDAKRNYNANPGDTRYNLMMQAKQPLKSADLQNIKKYTVQQRMINTPQPNGLPKTPQMLQREWQDENKRRQTAARDMYKNEVQGLKNRTGVNAVPTMTQPWGGR